MPITQGYMTKKGKRLGFYRWGTTNKKYPYEIGNEKSRLNARKKAARQGRAIKANQSG